MTTTLLHHRALGFVFCFNEEHILAECLRHYLSQGIDLVVIDNDSTDSSMVIVRDFQANGHDYPGRIQDVLKIHTQGYEWEKILAFACETMHARFSHYEWILLIDADAFYHSPVKGMSLLEFMDAVKKRGHNIIDGTLYEFYPTEKDDPSILSPLERLSYCRCYDTGPQQKIFLYHPTLRFLEGGHVIQRERPRVSLVRYRYFHYPWVSYEHGLKKIFQERNPRYVERRSNIRLSSMYYGLLPIKKDLIKESRTLIYYREERTLRSRTAFQALMTLHTPIKVCLSLRGVFRKGLLGKLRTYLSRFFILSCFDKRLALKLSLKYASRLIITRKRTSSPPHGFSTISTAEWIQQRPSAYGLPESYHFLMTDFCNAACIFCNQDFDPKSRKRMTLDKFKTILSNIPSVEPSTFHFSGGGEPLLCKDLFPIIDHVNQCRPAVKIHIRTNGLLTGKYAKELTRCRIARLEISIHGASKESNQDILHAKNHLDDAFEAITVLNRYLAARRNPLTKVFCPVVSRLNIDEIPALVRRASELQISEIFVVFSRYYPWETYQINGVTRAKSQDSLFYHKERYNEIILRSKKLARSLGISFMHEPLFFRKFKQTPCFQPWTTMIVNWDGEVFPCTGGEVWFNKKVRSTAYHFGNLLREHLTDFWNNETYTRIRRTNARHSGEPFIPECHNCHNTGCFKGPDVEAAHILRPI